MLKLADVGTVTGGERRPIKTLTVMEPVLRLKSDLSSTFKFMNVE